MRKIKKIGSLLVATAVAVSGIVSFPTDRVFADDASTTYTYTYDVWGDQQNSPDAYRAIKHISGDSLSTEELEVGNFSEPQGQFVRGNKLFICDTGNDRIIEVAYDGYEYKAVRVITEIKGIEGSTTEDNTEEQTEDTTEEKIEETKEEETEATTEEGSEAKTEEGGEGGENTEELPDGDIHSPTLSRPYDIYVTENMEMIIADYGNQRILHVDKDLNLIKEIVRPKDETYVLEGFLPQKLIMDTAGRIYAQVQNINKGLMEFDPNGVFTGYIGASPVSFNMIDYIWRMFMSEEQLERMEKFVPTEYNNIALDSEGFMYVTLSVFKDNDFLTANSVRRLNTVGSDILVRNGNSTPCGDIDWQNVADYSGPSRFYDVVTFDNDSYCCIDQTRGRIFAYDFQGNLLYAFGGSGNRLGYFRKPVAIDRMGSTLFVMDAQYANITVFEITEFGKLINDALREYQNADYNKSAEYWNEVLRYNGNYDLAYIGVGRALLRQDKYKEAMEYFKAKRDRRNYSKAFEQYRKEMVEDHIGDLVKALIVLLVGVWLIKKVRKIQKEVRECD